jgi:hypothetical protein
MSSLYRLTIPIWSFLGLLGVLVSSRRGIFAVNQWKMRNEKWKMENAALNDDPHQEASQTSSLRSEIFYFHGTVLLE